MHWSGLAGIVTACLITVQVFADDPPKTEEDLKRDAAIAEFTAKMKAANYPALFEQAAKEFDVPVDILKGIAFAETRWEHLTWPEGEAANPETGMPRPYGIMSLWDNEYFGHSLTEAAKLLGKEPEELKKDPLTNIRGAAALMKKLYGETPKPEGTSEADIESWRYAIVKYCGIPEPDLSQRHGLDVYEFMNEGFNQFGIQWEGRPVKLEAMRAEVKKIVAEERKKLEERMKNDPSIADGDVQFVANRAPAGMNQPNSSLLPTKSSASADAPTFAATIPPKPANESHLFVWVLVLFTAALVAFIVIANVRNQRSRRKR